VSTHSTEIQRNIPEEAGVWTLEPEGSVAILTATSANNNVPDRAALLAKLDGAGGGPWISEEKRAYFVPKLAVGGENRSDEREPD